MTKKLGIILITLVLLTIMAGCSDLQEEAEPEVVWDTLPTEEQGIEVTVSEAAKEQMEADWEEKSSRSLFMLIPGSS